MAKLTDLELNTILDGFEASAVSNQGEFMPINEELLRRYKGEPYGNEVPYRSKVISNDVQDVVEADMVSHVRTFLSSNAIFKFQPQNPDDENQVKEAEEKTAYVDWLIRKQKSSFRTQYGFLKDIEIQQMGILKYFPETTEEVEEHSWKGVDEFELQGYIDELTKGFGSREVETVKVEAHEDGTFDVTVKLVVKRQEIKIIGVPTELFLINQNCTDIEDAVFVGDKVSKTRGELLSEGVPRKLIEQMPTAGNYQDYSTNNSTMHEIRFNDEGLSDDEQQDFSQWANESVEITDIYAKVDYDQDGIAERRHIQRSGNVIIVNEVYNHVPYAMASALLMPHKAIGQGRAEQVTKIAEIKTALKRQMLDNGYMVNNPKMAANDNANIQELISQKIGGYARVKGKDNPLNSVAPIQIPFVGDKTMLLIQHMDQDRAQAVGTQLASQGLNSDDIGKETATRFKGVQDESKGKIETVARIIAEVGYRKLYEGVAWTVEHFQDSEREFSVNGKPLTSNPSKWKYETHLHSEVGLGAGDSDEIIENASAMLNLSLQLKDRQSPIVDETKVFNIMNKMYKAMGVEDVSIFANNPEEPAETLQAENEQLNQMVLQLQEQLQQMQNPLADAERIKQEAFLLKAQSDARIKVAQLEEDQRQFNADLIQKQEQFEKEQAMKLTDLELKYNQQANADHLLNKQTIDQS